MPTVVDALAPHVVQLLSFAGRQVRENPDFRHPLDRRNEERKQLIVPAEIQGVSPSLIPLEDPLDVVTRDISKSGVGLIVDGSLKHELYTVRLIVDDEEIFVLGLKAWSIPRGPYDFAGVDFLRKLQAD